MYSKELLKGTLQTIVLKLLSDHGKMYGYEISQKVKSLSDDTLVITEGALYPTLHKLEAEGLVRAETENVNNRTRKYYSLTPKGEKESDNRMSDFREYIDLMKNLFY